MNLPCDYQAFINLAAIIAFGLPAGQRGKRAEQGSLCPAV
jgi:hypothetical protein